MRTEVHLAPESQEEVELLERLADAREFALEEAELERESVAGIFAQMAAGLYGNIDNEEPERLGCPECGSPMDEVVSDGIGGEPKVEPCGCVTEWGELPEDLYFDE